MTERAFERCPTPNPWTGSSCKRRGCPVCGVGWAKNWGRVVESNLDEYLAGGGAVVGIAITPPGVELLPYSCTKDHNHHRAGCQAEDAAADAWAEMVTVNWRKLRDAAKKRVRDAKLPTDTLILARVWEPQKRGVPHLHVVAGAATEIERIAAQRFASELADLAADYFFGHVDRGHRVANQACPVTDHRDAKQLDQCICKRRLPLIGAEEASRYLVSYLTGRRGHSKKKPTIRENIAHPRMPKSLIWVTPNLTRITLVTMRRLRYVSWYFSVLNGRVDLYPRLFGENLYKVARVCARLDPKKARAPNGEDEAAAIGRHVANLKVMRRLQPPWDTIFGPSRRFAKEAWTPVARRAEGPLDPLGTARWDQLELMAQAAAA